MSHCHDQHSGHSHGNGHNHHGHDHSDDITPALQFNLYQYIQFDDINTFNEAERDLGKAVVKKTWAERLQVEPELVSDIDGQLIVHIPFTGQVKLHSILLRSSPHISAPRTLRAFINRDDIDFDNVDSLECTQEFELSQTSEVQEIPVKRALFSRVRNLTLYIVDNFASAVSDEDEDDDDDAVSRLSYLGFRGEWMQIGRAPENILYEAAPNPNDHSLKGTSVRKMGSSNHRM